jgi:lysyl-tRNA synthetase, class II
MSTDNTQQKSFSSVEAQRELRIDKLNKLKTLGFDPFTPDSHRDFGLAFIKYWFDFVHKMDFPERIWQMQVKLDDRLQYHNDAVMSQMVLAQAFENTLLTEAEEYTREWIETEFNGDEFLKQNFEDYVSERYQLITEIQIFRDNMNGYNAEQIQKLYQDFISDTDMKGDHKPAFIKTQKITLVGRIKAKRGSGKIAFAAVEDESLPVGFQFVFKSDLMPGSKSSLSFEQFMELLDDGDYIQATGLLDYSRTGEPSLFVEELKILTKALRPLPDGLEDIEQKYRQRYLDMKLNSEVRDMFVMKSKFWSAAREYMVQNGFIELQSPTMEETTGGAEASPFVTHHNANDEDYFLRISSELHLKRYIVGGFEKVFDIDKNFRNEGIDDEHLQEFTQLEFYWAYGSFEQLLDYTERLYKHIILKSFGTLKLEKDGKEIDWEKPWPRIKYLDFVEQYGGIKLADYDTIPKLQALCDKLGVKYEEFAGKGRLIDQIYKKVARPKCIEPIWLTHLPVEMSPLAKRDPANPELTLRAHPLAYGSELGNGFSELNDPIDQLKRFQEQQDLREGGDDEAMMIDLDYVNALEIAMPPTIGFGFSERLFSVLMQKPIRETTAFPLMKRKNLSEISTDSK